MSGCPSFDLLHAFSIDGRDFGVLRPDNALLQRADLVRERAFNEAAAGRRSCHESQAESYSLGMAFDFLISETLVDDRGRVFRDESDAEERRMLPSALIARCALFDFLNPKEELLVESV